MVDDKKRRKKRAKKRGKKKGVADMRKADALVLSKGQVPVPMVSLPPPPSSAYRQTYTQFSPFTPTVAPATNWGSRAFEAMMPRAVPTEEIQQEKQQGLQRRYGSDIPAFYSDIRPETVAQLGQSVQEQFQPESDMERMFRERPFRYEEPSPFRPPPTIPYVRPNQVDPLDVVDKGSVLSGLYKIPAGQAFRKEELSEEQQREDRRDRLANRVRKMFDSDDE